jgi:hypothetical protein
VISKKGNSIARYRFDERRRLLPVAARFNALDSCQSKKENETIKCERGKEYDIKILECCRKIYIYLKIYNDIKSFVQ